MKIEQIDVPMLLTFVPGLAISTTTPELRNATNAAVRAADAVEVSKFAFFLVIAMFVQNHQMKVECTHHFVPQLEQGWRRNIAIESA